MTSSHELKAALLIEDDPDIVKLISMHIGDLGFSLDVATDGLDGVERAIGGDYQLLLLDLGLPKLGGVEICKRVRAKKPLLPIVMLTSRSEEVDTVVGFQVGADDYVVKPFSMRELLARISALLRRVDAVSDEKLQISDGVIEVHELRINTVSREVFLSGALQDLTPTEFDLLVFMAAQPGRAFTREQLVEDVLGYHGQGYEKSINSHISRLRSKLEKDPENPDYIKTVWGIGYCFSKPS